MAATYDDDLYAVYQSEILGRALFGTAAALALGTDRREKFRALVALEEQTLQRYLERVAGREVGERRAPSALSGYLYGLLFALLPWRAAMKALDGGTDGYLEVFRRLQVAAPEEDRQFCAYVVAHEEAIQAFARLELNGEPSLSLAPIQDLLA